MGKQQEHEEIKQARPFHLHTSRHPTYALHHRCSKMCVHRFRMLLSLTKQTTTIMKRNTELITIFLKKKTYNYLNL